MFACKECVCDVCVMFMAALFSPVRKSEQRQHPSMLEWINFCDMTIERNSAIKMNTLLLHAIAYMDGP